MKFGIWLVLIFYHVRDNFAIGLYGLVGLVFCRSLVGISLLDGHEFGIMYYFHV